MALAKASHADVAASFRRTSTCPLGLDALGHDSISVESPISIIEATSWRGSADSTSGTLRFDLSRRGLASEADNRGVAGAEIVDLDVDAELFDLVDVPADELAFRRVKRLDELGRKPCGLDREVAQP